MKKLVPAIALALASMAPTAFGSPSGPTILSYNIRHGKGADGKVDLQRIADSILREKPDLVCLNEVDCRVERSGGADQTAELGRLTGMHGTFAKAIDYCGGEYGNAVLSREKPLSVVRVPLPGKEPRVLLACEFAGCWLFATHLDGRILPGDDGPASLRSASIIREEVAKRAKTKPVFLAGDWNARPDSKTIAAIKEYMAILSPVDCRTFHGFKKHDPSVEYCIDYITVDRAHADGFTVVETHVAPDAVSSDHYPVAVSLRAKARAAGAGFPGSPPRRQTSGVAPKDFAKTCAKYCADG